MPPKIKFCNQISFNEWEWSTTIDFFEAVLDQLEILPLISSVSANANQCSASFFTTAAHWPLLPLLLLKWRKGVAVLSRCLWINAHAKKAQVQLVRRDLG